ncbi:MAG: ATP-binding protein, partial [Betaproteobacteria bacterium]|nr:ATP-binding protein [Betaproteobacteria bacterium]
MDVARYLQSSVTDALKSKMVFVGGPRQVGKTTFALGFLGKDADPSHPAYLNWDHPAVPARLRRAELPA